MLTLLAGRDWRCGRLPVPASFTKGYHENPSMRLGLFHADGSPKPTAFVTQEYGQCRQFYGRELGINVYKRYATTLSKTMGT
jgi:hypothetical protein